MDTKKIGQIVEVWLKNVSQDAAYLPFLGPVYFSKNNKRRILNDVLKYAERETFLPYDKNQRWFEIKTEKIIVSEIVIKNRKDVYLPIIDRFQKKIKIFFYSRKNPKKENFLAAQNIFQRIINKQDIKSFTFYCFKKPRNSLLFNCHHLYLKLFSVADLKKDFEVAVLLSSVKSPKIYKTLSTLGKQKNLEGFNFLWRQFLKSKGNQSPIFCIVKNEKIVGAAGPLSTIKDETGNNFLAPFYFGVSAKSRKKNYGTFLWRAAMRWGYENKARYLLIQAQKDSPADYFYKKQDLLLKGRIYSRIL